MSDGRAAAVALTNALFAGKRWRAPQNHSFVERLTVLPLAAQEIAAIATEFPVYFGQQGEDWQVFTTLALGPDRFDADGFLAAKALPFLVKIYPFTACQVKGAFVLGVFPDPACISETGKPFFEGNAPAPTVVKLQSKLAHFVKGLKVAGTAAKSLAAAGVLEKLGPQDANGWTIWQVNENKLANLKPDLLVELHRGGGLGMAYTQLISQVHSGERQIGRPSTPKPIREVANDGFIDAVFDDINDLTLEDMDALLS